MADKTLFFALWPSHRQRDMLRDTIGPALSSVEGTAVDRRNWHLTLVYIGDFPEEKIPGLLSAVDVIDPGEIRLRFDTLTFWQRPTTSTPICGHAARFSMTPSTTSTSSPVMTRSEWCSRIGNDLVQPTVSVSAREPTEVPATGS